VLASYVAVFLLLAIRLVLVFPEAIPVRLDLSDAHVITWVLAWVAHSLAVDPGRVFDANISFPAQGQLVGMDHLFGAQVLYAPIYALTGNPVLSANLVAFLSYPLAALGMERLLRELRVPPVVRWVTGFAFALGLSRVPFNLNLIPFSNLYLPWTALALTRLRSRPTVPRAVVLLLAFGLAIFASFYEAVLVGLTCAVWGAFELARGGERRGRFVGLALGSAGVAGVLLLLAITPYFTHVGGSASALADFQLPMPTGGWAMNAWLVLGLGAPSVGKTPRLPIEVATLLVAALLALVAWATGSRTARRIVPVALTLWLLGAILSYGYPGGLAPLIQASPLRMIRYLHRYAVIGEFGLLLLLAVGLTALRDWLGTRAAAVASVALVAIVLVGRGVPFASSPMHVVGLAKNAAVYDAVAEVLKDEGGGPLLELPIFGMLPGQTDRATTLEPDAMLASTRHWWQTPAAHTSDHAPQRWFFMNTVAALPAWWALEDLIDLTHVRWLLLRPAEYWRPAEARETTEKFLRKAPDVEVMWKNDDGWLLFRLDRMPRHRAWFEAAKKAERGNGRSSGRRSSRSRKRPRSASSAPIPRSRRRSRAARSCCASSSRTRAIAPGRRHRFRPGRSRSTGGSACRAR